MCVHFDDSGVALAFFIVASMSEDLEPVLQEPIESIVAHQEEHQQPYIHIKEFVPRESFTHRSGWMP